MGLDFQKKEHYLLKGNKGDLIFIKATPDDESLRIRVPKPQIGAKILFSDLPKEDQYWKRQAPPERLTQDTEREYHTFIKNEIIKIRDGVWFMNNGVVTYITGAHYYYINYIEIDIGYPDYRDRDRKFFYTWKIVEDDPVLRGIILVKPRRMGASWIGTALLLHKITQTKKSLGGILSKSGQDAKEFFTDKLVMAWKSLPFWLSPLVSSGTDPKTSLVFSKPADKSKASANKGGNTSVGLNSKIDYRPTKMRSYDSMKLIRVVYDEVGKIEGKVDAKGKWTGLNLGRQWGILKKTLGLKVKTGMAFLPSTVGDLTEGGAQFKTLVYKSMLSTLNENGSTTTGLLAYFIPAYDGLEGFIDIYGKSVIKNPKKPVMGVDGDWITIGAKTYLDRERNGLKDQSDLIEYKREMPYSLKEAFYDKAGKSIFNLGKIQTQLDWLENEPEGRLVTRGYFKWDNGIRDSRVEFVRSDNGKVVLTMLPPNPNEYKWRGGAKHPVNTKEFAGGVDSYDINKTTWGSGSNGALVIYCKDNANPEIETEFKKSFVLTYLAREPKAPIFYEQVLMATVYFSTPILVENNKPRILEYFRERGYGEYLSYRPDKPLRELSSNERELRGIPSVEKTIITQGEELQNYIEDELGIHPDGSMGRCYLYDLIDDWRRFKIDNRTAYDLSVASGLALMLGNKFEAQIRRVSGNERSAFRKYTY